MANRGKGTKRHSKRKRGGRLCLRRRRHCCRGHRRRRGRRLRDRHCSRSNSGCRFRRLSSSSSSRPRASRSCTEGLWSRIGASQRRGRMPAFSRSSHRLPAARQNASVQQAQPPPASGAAGLNREALRREALDAHPHRKEVCEAFSPDEWYSQVAGNWAVYMGEEEGTDYRQTYRWLDTLKALGGAIDFAIDVGAHAGTFSDKVRWRFPYAAFALLDADPNLVSSWLVPGYSRLEDTAVFDRVLDNVSDAPVQLP